MKRAIVVAVLLLGTIRVHAGVGVCQQTSQKIEVVFVNGIMNTPYDAEASKNFLEDVLYQALPPDQFNRLEFKVAYNQSYGFFSDLYESLLQRLPQDNVAESFFRWVAGENNAPAVVRDEALQLESNFDYSTRVGTNDLDNHLALYRTEILQGKPVLIIAHSQGNFFANAEYDVLYNGANPIPLGSFAIVSVANPASFVGGGGPYTTAVEDLVIQAVSLATPIGMSQPLPPNITNVGSGVTTSDWLGHSIEREYLVDGSPTEKKIVNDISDALNALAVPAATVQDGDITVTLTWGAQPDVDLHVFEPDGTHVYYANRQGDSGYQDVDDRDGYGPENYFVSCGQVALGVYHVGVNYYYGTAPETATVQVSAGNSVRTFTVSLAASDGSAGDNSPIPVADITVTEDGSGGYDFVITQANQ